MICYHAAREGLRFEPSRSIFLFFFSFFPRTVNRAKEREKKKKFMVVAGSILTRPGNKLIGVRVGIPFDTAATDETLRGASEMIN